MSEKFNPPRVFEMTQNGSVWRHEFDNDSSRIASLCISGECIGRRGALRDINEVLRDYAGSGWREITPAPEPVKVEETPLETAVRKLRNQHDKYYLDDIDWSSNENRNDLREWVNDLKLVASAYLAEHESDGAK